MKNLVQLTIGILLFGTAVVPAQTTFSNLYIFGDALSATADSRAPGGSYFYGQRWSNGRVWIEVLAQRQGLTYDAGKNISYYDHNSGEVVTDVANFKAPPDVANDLFILWVCNADTFDAAQNHDNSVQWTIANTLSQSNHLLIITSLYAKGVRTLIMPNAVDISEIPAYNQSTFTNAMHNGCIAYNIAFSNTINQAKLLCPGLQIYTPDYFTLLNNVLTNAAYYGLTNALYNGYSIDAFSDPSIINLTLNGQGTNYIFWDPQDPTAKLHEIMADVAQQMISPVQISRLAVFNGSNRLDMANMPVGLNGFVDGSTNLAAANWTAVTNINSASVTQSVFVSASPLTPSGLGSLSGSGGGSINPNNPGTNTVSNTNIVYNAQFYRLQFPYAWSWP